MSSRTFKDYAFASFRPPRERFRVRSVGHYALLEADEGSFKRADFPEIFWCVAGMGDFRGNDGKNYLLRPGFLWYYPTGSYHEFRPARVVGREAFLEYRWLALEGEYAHWLFDGLGFHAGSNYAGDCPEELFLEVELRIGDPSRAARKRVLGTAFRILTTAAGAGEPDSPRGTLKEEPGRDPVAAARRAAEENFSDPALNVQRLSETVRVSRVYLSREFARRYGVPPGKFLASLRLAKGLKLLREKQGSVAEIARNCGFSGAGYFGKVIRKTAGLPPGKL